MPALAPFDLPALPSDLLAVDFDLLALALGLLAVPFDLLAAALGLLVVPLGLLAVPLGLPAAALGLLAVLFAAPVLAFGFALLDRELLDRELPELLLVDLVCPEPARAFVELLFVELLFVELLFVELPFLEGSDPLLDASAVRALRRTMASLAIRSSEALPLLRFRAAVARVTEAASLAAAWALRGLLAIVAISSAEQAADLLGLLAHGLDLTGELAELLSGSSDLVSDAAQIHLLRHGDAKNLARLLGLARQQRSTDRPDGGTEHRYAEVGESFVLAVGRLVVSIRITRRGARLGRRTARRRTGALGGSRPGARPARPVFRGTVFGIRA